MNNCYASPLMETLTAPNRISYQWNNVVAWLIEVYLGHIFHLCLLEYLIVVQYVNLSQSDAGQLKKM